MRLQTSTLWLPRVFPPCVVVNALEFAPADAGGVAADIALPASIRNSVAKRQREFVAGRVCARQALRAAGAPATEEIPIGFLRAPVWPRGFVGSITHTAGVAAVAVARSTDARSVGLDLEPIISAEAAGSVASMVARSEELCLATDSGLAPHVALTVVFSVKEALYKCLAPLVGRVFDFLEVQAISVTPQTLSLRLRSGLGEDFREDQRLDASFAVFGNTVVAGVFLPA